MSISQLSVVSGQWSGEIPRVATENGQRTTDKFRTGFSFVEVLFAVIILGVGFIMIAAIFPVAIQQTKLTREESSAAEMARSGLGYMDRIANNSDTGPTAAVNSPLIRPTGYGAAGGSPFPTVGTVEAVRDWAAGQPAATYMPLSTFTSATSFWSSVRGNLILPDDPRYAWAVLYRREGDPANRQTWDSKVQLFLIQAQVRNNPTFRSDPTQNDVGAAPIANLQPRPVAVQIANNYQGNGTDLISFSRSADATYMATERDAALNCVAEGTFVIIRDDRITTNNDNGRMNGRIYRVGVQRADLGATTWELMPGYDFTPDAGADGIPGGLGAADDIYGIGNTVAIAPSAVTAAAPAEAWILGRGFTAPGATPILPDGYSGPAMDIGVYTTWVKVN